MNGHWATAHAVSRRRICPDPKVARQTVRAPRCSGWCWGFPPPRTRDPNCVRLGGGQQSCPRAPGRRASLGGLRGRVNTSSTRPPGLRCCSLRRTSKMSPPASMSPKASVIVLADRYGQAQTLRDALGYQTSAVGRAWTSKQDRELISAPLSNRVAGSEAALRRALATPSRCRLPRLAHGCRC